MYNYIIFFFNDTATTEIYTLSLHDALPIFFHYSRQKIPFVRRFRNPWGENFHVAGTRFVEVTFVLERSEEHTSELQSRQYLVCRLLLEKKIASVIIVLVVHYPFTHFVHLLK